MCDGKSGRSPKRFSGRLRFRQHSAFPYFSRVKFTWRVLVAGERSEPSRIKTVTCFYGHYKFALFGCYDSSFIDELGYGFFSLDYSVKMC